MWFPFVEVSEIGDLAAAFEDPAQSIRTASYRVFDELRTASFDVHAAGDDEGHPVDWHVTAAIKDATKAQLSFWAETGDESGAGAQNGGGSILSVSLPGGGGTTSLAAKQEARVAPAVAEILRAAPGIRWGVGY
ncbi:hypothetical protein AB0230_07055 [Microbacterium sp. NPDC089190]|uniref:hypothetical protein n=1 Tax=Microbacterium sp. NPDC089190 TaxID=3155063 RepID=UPI00344C5325